MNQPAVTVLMPVYNAEPFLREAIDSILNQTFTDFEFVIINDGSSDTSEDIIKSYSDPRIRYYKNEHNIKLIATLNKGISMANGKYIARMDADDVSLPQRLQKQVAFMEQHQQIVVCGSWAETFGSEEVLVRYLASHEDIMFKMLYQCHLIHPTIIMRAKEIKAFNPLFDPDFIHAEDYELFVRIGYQYQLANIPEVLLKYRSHVSSVSKQYSAIQEQNSSIIRHSEFKHLGFPVTDKLLNDFIELNHQAPANIKSAPGEIKALLEGMLLANQKSNAFSPGFMQQKLSYLWFHYCYQVSTPAFFYSSALLSKITRPSLMQSIKWRLKAR